MPPEEAQVIDQPIVDAPVVDAPVVDTPEIEIEHPEAAQVETRPEGPSRGQRINALTGKARDYYKQTGDLSGAEAKQAKSLPAAPKAETEPDSGPGVKTEQPTKQVRNFRAVTEKLSATERELIAAKAKLELYERQNAASGPSAPATPKSEAKPATAEDPRPKFPNIKDFSDEEKYDKAIAEWQTQDADWMQRQFDRRLTGEQQRQQFQQSAEKWNAQLENGRKQHKDFDQIALNESTPVSYATMAHIQSLPDGALRSYALGKNLEVATRIAELTHIPGEHQFKSFPEFMKWVKSDAERAMLYGEKLALAKAELAKLQVGPAPKNPAAPQTKPLKEVIRAQARPSAEVNTDEPAGPVMDPLQKAILDMKNKVPGAFKAYQRLRNEADRRAKNGR